MTPRVAAGGAVLAAFLAIGLLGGCGGGEQVPADGAGTADADAGQVPRDRGAGPDRRVTDRSSADATDAQSERDAADAQSERDAADGIDDLGGADRAGPDMGLPSNVISLGPVIATNRVALDDTGRPWVSLDTPDGESQLVSAGANGQLERVSTITNGIPLGLAFSAGRLYFLEQTLHDSVVGYYELASGQQEQLDLSQLTPGVTSGPSVDPDGNLWFGDQTANTVLRVDTTGAQTGFPVTLQGNYSLGAIAAESPGLIWFWGLSSGPEPTVVGLLNPGGQLQSFPIEGFGYPLAVLSDGRLQFDATANGPARVGLADSQGTIEYVTVSEQDTYVTGIAAGPDGVSWSAVCKIDLTTVSGALIRRASDGTLTRYDLPLELLKCSLQTPIAIAPDGTLWIVTQSQSDQGFLHKITP